MGRQHHLTRLALGRSAFREEPARSPLGGSTTDAINPSPSFDGESLVQQYDEKGRSINPATEMRQKAMREAQNEVLAGVGVCERKEDAARQPGTHGPFLTTEQRVTLAVDEEYCAELLDLIANAARLVLSWWPECILARIQAGLYDPSLNFFDIVALEYSNTRPTDLRSLSELLPGLTANGLSTLVKALTLNGIGTMVNHIDTWLLQRLSKGWMRKRLRSLLTVSEYLLVFATEVVLLPLTMHGYAAALGLIPASQLLPPLQSFNPWSPWSPFGLFASELFVGQGILHKATRMALSPAVLLTTFQAFVRSSGESEPPFSILTSFRRPKVKLPLTEMYNCGTLDLVGRLFNNLHNIRNTTLKSLGWKPLTLPLPPDLSTAEADIWLATSLHPPTTPLVLLPTRALATSIDSLFSLALCLPLESLVLRSITAAVLASPYPLTDRANAAKSLIYNPVGRGPVAQVWASNGAAQQWAALGDYASRIGLGLAMRASVDGVVFAALYSAAVRQGIKHFGWTRMTGSRAAQ